MLTGIMINRRTLVKGLVSSPFLALFKTGTSWANIPSVRLEAKAAAGGEQTEIAVHVSHKGNSMFHYVDRVTLFADGAEIKKWEYSWLSLPPAENFTVSHKLTLDRETTFSALANCTVHGENPDRGDTKVAPGS